MKRMHLWKNIGTRGAAAILSSAIVAGPSSVLACPMCEVALKGDPVVAAFNGTTMLLIAVPALLFGSIGGWVSYVYWRAGRQAERLDWSSNWTEKESRT
jgi:hypothetical protein